MENNMEIINLTDENGEKVTFEVLDTVMVEEKKYLIVSEEGMEEDDALVLCMEDKGEQCYFRPVEDSKELELVEEAYEELWLDEE